MVAGAWGGVGAEERVCLDAEEPGEDGRQKHWGRVMAAENGHWGAERMGREANGEDEPRDHHAIPGKGVGPMEDHLHRTSDQSDQRGVIDVTNRRMDSGDLQFHSETSHPRVKRSAENCLKRLKSSELLLLPSFEKAFEWLQISMSCRYANIRHWLYGSQCYEYLRIARGAMKVHC